MVEEKNGKQSEEKLLGPIGLILVIGLPIVLFLVALIKLSSDTKPPSVKPGETAKPTVARPRHTPGQEPTRVLESEFAVAMASQMARATLDNMVGNSKVWFAPEAKNVSSIAGTVSGPDGSKVQLQAKGLSDWMLSAESGEEVLLGSGSAAWHISADSMPPKRSDAAPEILYNRILTGISGTDILATVASSPDSFEVSIGDEQVCFGSKCYLLTLTAKHPVEVFSWPVIAPEDGVAHAPWTATEITIWLERFTGRPREITALGDDKKLTVNYSEYKQGETGPEVPTFVESTYEEEGVAVLKSRSQFAWSDSRAWTMTETELIAANQLPKTYVLSLQPVENLEIDLPDFVKEAINQMK